MLAGYSPKDNHVLPVAFMIIAIGFLCTNHAGTLANHLDIAPNFGSVLLGITNTVGTLSGCIAPLVTGYFTKSQVSIFINSLANAEVGCQGYSYLHHIG